MDRTNAEVTIQTATAKLKWMHCLQKNGYVKYDELKSIGLEFGIDLYYIEEIILRDLPVVIITACEYSKLDRGTKQKWVLLTSFPDDLTSFPDDLTSLQMKKYIEFICQLMYKHDKEMLQLRMAVGELMDRLYHKSRSLKQHVIANEVKSIIWEMFDPQICEKVFRTTPLTVNNALSIDRLDFGMIDDTEIRNTCLNKHDDTIAKCEAKLKQYQIMTQQNNFQHFEHIKQMEIKSQIKSMEQRIRCHKLLRRKQIERNVRNRKDKLKKELYKASNLYRLPTVSNQSKV
eukprot:781409_1